MVKRIGQIKNVPARPMVDRIKVGGLWVETGDLVYATPANAKRRCIAKVSQIVVTGDGELDYLTVALWQKLNGSDHAQKGLTRILTPTQVSAMRTQREQRAS